MQMVEKERQFFSSGDAADERLRGELEAVQYALSHDVLAPLRAIASECEELGRNSTLDAAGRETAGRLAHETARMKAMLQGVVEYVQLETFVPPHEPLDANELVDDAVAALQMEIQDTGAAVTRDTLPPVMGHRGRLTRLFAYLLDNALKFHGAAPPVAHISVRLTAGQMWEFCVEDNGIGVDAAYRDAVFRLFQRMHPAGAYPGYGIGLALSRKITGSHGGRLWVEPAPQGGSRFCFTLPASDRNA